jgi:hypothetical protein
VQVAVPAASVESGHVGEPGPVRVQVTVPVGVTPDPVTVTVKVKLPPGDVPWELSVTETVGVAMLPVAVKAYPNAESIAPQKDVDGHETGTR